MKPEAKKSGIRAKRVQRPWQVVATEALDSTLKTLLSPLQRSLPKPSFDRVYPSLTDWVGIEMGNAKLVVHEDDADAAYRSLLHLCDLHEMLLKCGAPRADAGRFKRAVRAIDKLLSGQLTTAGVEQAQRNLRQALGRKAGREGQASGIPPAKREELAVKHLAENPTATREALRLVSGMSLTAQSRSSKLAELRQALQVMHTKPGGGLTKRGIIHAGHVDAEVTHKACPFCGASYDPKEGPEKCSKCGTALP